MENTRLAPLKKFYAVSLRESGPAVSLVTETYFLLQKKGAPEFYKRFIYQPFLSRLTFTQLHTILPFRLDSTQLANPSDTEPLPLSLLTEAELGHLRAHLYLLDIYKQYHLEPIPPWLHIQRGSSASSQLASGLADLELYSNLPAPTDISN